VDTQKQYLPLQSPPHPQVTPPIRFLPVSILRHFPPLGNASALSQDTVSRKGQDRVRQVQVTYRQGTVQYSTGCFF